MRLRRRKPHPESRGAQQTYTIPKCHALGTKGICPFCHYIGPPLLCGCVTDLYRSLGSAYALLEQLGKPGTYTVPLGQHRERIKILNERLDDYRP